MLVVLLVRKSPKVSTKTRLNFAHSEIVPKKNSQGPGEVDLTKALRNPLFDTLKSQDGDGGTSATETDTDVEDTDMGDTEAEETDAEGATPRPPARRLPPLRMAPVNATPSSVNM
eukprot:1190176-Prorocentrum_minimum.AAC.2